MSNTSQARGSPHEVKAKRSDEFAAFDAPPQRVRAALNDALIPITATTVIKACRVAGEAYCLTAIAELVRKVMRDERGIDVNQLRPLRQPTKLPPRARASGRSRRTSRARLIGQGDLW